MLPPRLALATFGLLVLVSTAVAAPSLDDLAREWSTSDDHDILRLGKILLTGSGREALRERLAADREAMIAEAREAAFRELAADAYPVPRDRTPPSWLARLAMDYAIDVDSVHSRIATILPRLSTKRFWERDLAEFLSRDDAAEILYERFLRRYREPNPYSEVLSRVLVEGDDDRYRIHERLRVATDGWLADQEAIAAAGARFSSAVAAHAATLPEGCRSRNLLADPRYAAMRFRKSAAGRAADVAVLIGGNMAGVIAEIDADSDIDTEVLWFERELARRRQFEREARWIAARIDDEAGDLEARLRALLRSPFGPLLAVDPKDQPGFDAGKVLLERSGFARFLVLQVDGSWSVNPHTIVELDVLLRSLSEEGDRRAALAETIGGDPAARILARYAEREVASLEPDAWGAWLGRNLVRGEKGWERRPGRMREIEQIVDTAHRIAWFEIGEDLDYLGNERPDRRGINLGNSLRVDLDPTALEFTSGGLHLFRSSAFYNPRTRAGSYWYSAAFPDHYAARLFGTFDWNAGRSSSVDDFLLRIREVKPAIARLAETHERIIFIIGSMPTWLSSSKDQGTFEGGARSNATAHPPRDWGEWERMVKGMAETFADIEGADRSYEFWNEPDLEYWQGSLADFLKLYEVTARAVKAGDPGAKFGGCAVNQWDGRIRKGATSDPLALELIRFAAKQGLPLDFISWHHFGRSLRAIGEAKESFLAECEAVGLGHRPELHVTEWSWPYRGAPFAAVSFAETMVALAEAGVDVQTASCWEEFHPVPDPNGFAPWGMMTQQGVRKNAWYVHRFFDRLSRNSAGWCVLRPEEGAAAVVSREVDGTLELIVWRTRAAVALKRAMEAGGFADDDGWECGHLDRLERALADDRPVDAKQGSRFTAARQAYATTPAKTTRLRLDIRGATSIEVLEAESVRMEHAVKDVSTVGGRLLCELKPYEVLRLRIRVK